MSLSEQIQRVDGGQNAALKELIEKLGGTVPSTTKIDEYAALIEALTIYTAAQQLSSTTKTKFGLSSSANPDNVFNKLSSAVVVGSGNSLKDMRGNNIAIPSNQLSEKPLKFVFGSYVGTGTSGVSNPTRLTFDFEPRVVFICPNIIPTNYSGPYYAYVITFFSGAGSVATTMTGNGWVESVAVTWEGGNLSFYTEARSDPSDAQLNNPSYTYYYLALG